MKYKTMFLGLVVVVAFGIMIQVMNPSDDLVLTKHNTLALSKRLQTQDFQLNRVLIRQGAIVENKVFLNQNRLQEESGSEIKLKVIQFELLPDKIVLALEIANKQVVTVEEQIDMSLAPNLFLLNDSLETLEFGETYLLAYASNTIYSDTVTLSDLYTHITTDSNSDEFIVLTLQFI
ncbi:hypothetical protein [Erysipelothrix rhusiopathiae]|uniref:hypothetical protein n=1 Tax=Erysipelothrix rhusiopathiae TaxID=1648 RepID=UPI002B246454|nr:hypothetical protein [Erysipelothrix rhusiopathiae]WRB92746.1 hypothetical protein LL063_07215 [Erysipelothrix rhusiopathiae]